MPLPLPSAAESTLHQVDYTNVGDLNVPFYANERHPEIACYRGRPGGSGGEDERFWNPRMPPYVPSDNRPGHLFNSREAADAAGAAARVEYMAPWPDDGEDEDFCPWPVDEEAFEIAWVEHKHALRRLRESFPEVGEEHHTRPCPCGRGALAVWPWVVADGATGVL